MSVKNLSFYLDNTDIMLRSSHLPLRKFLEKNTLNSKVNSWAIEIEHNQIIFEYIKVIKNTLADTVNRLIIIDPDICQDPELKSHEYGYCMFEELPSVSTKKDFLLLLM